MKTYTVRFIHKINPSIDDVSPDINMDLSTWDKGVDKDFRAYVCRVLRANKIFDKGQRGRVHQSCGGKIVSVFPYAHQGINIWHSIVLIESQFDPHRLLENISICLWARRSKSPIRTASDPDSYCIKLMEWIQSKAPVSGLLGPPWDYYLSATSYFIEWGRLDHKNQEILRNVFPCNANGLTFHKWLYAAGRSEDRSNFDCLRRAWFKNEDPSDWKLKK